MKWLILLLLLAFNTAIAAQDIPDIWSRCQVTGSVTIYDPNSDKWFYTDTTEAHKRTLPASTFKIPHTLIALEEGLVTNSESIMKYQQEIDTLKYGYRPDIQKDLTLRQAYIRSAVWVYINFSKRIPKIKYEKYLEDISYGNGKIYDQKADFWNFGDFGVTPVEQINFLVKLYKEELPFRNSHQKELKEIMLDKSIKGYSVHAKTGWTRTTKSHIGWWVGYLESGVAPLFFATRIYRPIKANSAGFGECRKEITLETISNEFGLNYE